MYIRFTTSSNSINLQPPPSQLLTTSYLHLYLHRGLSSTVRRCVARETGHAFAVKIIDKSQEESIRQSIQAEIDVLHHLPPHRHISEWVGGGAKGWGQGPAGGVHTLHWRLMIEQHVFHLNKVFLLSLSPVCLQDVFETPTYNFMVFEL